MIDTTKGRAVKRKHRPRIVWRRIDEPGVHGYETTIPIFGIRIERIRCFPGQWSVFVRTNNGTWILTPMSGETYGYHQAGRMIRGYVDSLV